MLILNKSIFTLNNLCPKVYPDLLHFPSFASCIVLNFGVGDDDNKILTNHFLQVTKSQPVTGCRKEPIELCSKDGCGFSEV